MAAPRPPFLSHAVLLSADVHFHEVMERALRFILPVLNVSRVHPEGSPTTLKGLLGAPGRAGAWLFIDFRTPFKAAGAWAVLSEWVGGGGRAVLIVETPHSARGIPELPGMRADLLAHNRHWEPELLAPVLNSMLSGEGFVHLARAAEREVGTVIQGEAIITSPRQKRDYVESLLKALQDAGVQRTKRNSIAAVTDELLMNAVYDAPANSPGSRYYKQKWGPSNAEFDLDPGKKVAVHWAMADGDLHLAVRDPYGSIALDVLMKRIATFLTERTVTVSHGGLAGGGVGLYRVMRSCSLFSVYVEPGEFTEVCVRTEIAPSKTHRTKREKEMYVYFAAPKRR